jgi:hypothetical protein
MFRAGAEGKGKGGKKGKGKREKGKQGKGKRERGKRRAWPPFPVFNGGFELRVKSARTRSLPSAFGLQSSA